MTKKLYYGWVVVAVCSVVLLVAFGVRLSFTAFFVALITDFGWSRADTAFIFSLTMIIFTVGSTAAGIALDRFGGRIMFTLGAILLAGGLFLSSRITSFGQLVISYGIIAGSGITILGLSQQAAVIARWFRKQRGTAIGIAFAGTGLGALLIIPSVTWAIERLGWRRAFFALALLTVSTIPLIALFLRTNPYEKGLRIDNGQTTVIQPAAQVGETWTFAAATRTPTFWLLIMAAAGTMAPVRLLTVHQLAAIHDAGFALSVGARSVGLTGATVAVTFVLSGWLSDRIGRIPTYTLGGVCLIGAILTLSALQPDSPSQLLWLYALLLGLGEGSRSSLVAATASDLFPGDALGTINGAVGSAFGFGAAFLPWYGGRLFDMTGSYTIAFQLGIGIALGSMILFWCAIWLRNR